MSVYFIHVGRYFKIGYTDDPQRRFDRLHQGGTRYTFPADASWSVDERDLYKVIRGDKSAESSIHLALDNFAVGLEWFLDEPPLREFIDALPEELSDEQRWGMDPVARVGGWCADEFRAVQNGRAEREVARYMARRAS